MAKGVFIRSEETKRRLAERCREMCKNRPPSYGMLGKTLSPEARQKISEAVKRNHHRYWAGKTFSPEHRRKLSEAGEGHDVSPETRTKISKANVVSHRGLKHSEEWKRHMSLTMRGRFLGEQSPNWKGGVTPANKRIRKSPEYADWRKAVFTRDNWTCKKHGDKGGRLHPHHILNFSQHPSVRFDPDNGITLCEEAHRQFHKEYGKQNNSYEQMKSFLNAS